MKCRNLSDGKYFPVTVNIFPVPLELLFCSNAFVYKIMRGNIIPVRVYNIFYLLVTDLGKFLPQKGKVLTALVIFADLFLSSANIYLY